jgi:hypothetical protein
MEQFGGKDTKRHFTVVMGGKEHGLYVSSTPSSAAKKAVTKLCAANKSKKVEFSMREITQGSKKKTYGTYKGHLEKLKEPIELKGRVIKYKPVAKLDRKKGAQKGGAPQYYPKQYIDIECQTIGSGNNLITAQQYSEFAKESLEKDPIISPYIEKIEFPLDRKLLDKNLLDKKQYLRVFIKEDDISRTYASTIRTKADKLPGCRARLVENSHFINQGKKEKEGFKYFGEYIPPNSNISKTFESKL